METYQGKMKVYYQDATFEDLLHAPEPLGDSVEVIIFVDVSHPDEKLDNKSVTEVLVYVGDMIIKDRRVWPSVQGIKLLVTRRNRVTKRFYFIQSRNRIYLSRELSQHTSC